MIELNDEIIAFCIMSNQWWSWWQNFIAKTENIPTKKTNWTNEKKISKTFQSFFSYWMSIIINMIIIQKEKISWNVIKKLSVKIFLKNKFKKLSIRKKSEIQILWKKWKFFFETKLPESNFFHTYHICQMKCWKRKKFSFPWIKKTNKYFSRILFTKKINKHTTIIWIPPLIVLNFYFFLQLHFCRNPLFGFFIVNFLFSHFGLISIYGGNLWKSLTKAKQNYATKKMIKGG